MKKHTIIAMLICCVIFATALRRGQDQSSLEGKYALAFIDDALIVQPACSPGKGPLRGLETPPGMSPFLFLKIPVNRAGPGLLETIPGVGPSTAGLIVSYREKYGAIKNGEDLVTIRGIGRKRLETLESFISYE